MAASLTIQILTFNEAEALPRCLASLAGLEAEVLVVDSLSEDATREIARQAGARVLERRFDNFASQFNWGMDQAAGDWIFLIDADEVMDDQLREAVRAALAAPKPDREVYCLIRDSIMLGRRMRAPAWSGERLPRLFRKGCLRYSGLVHPHPELGGRRPALLEGRLLHHTYRSLDHFLHKMRGYARLWAADAHARGRRAGLLRVFLSAGWRFLHDYAFRAGFLDGAQGLLASGVYAFYTFEKYARLWELGRDRRV